jgi:hypothetical protein
LSIRLYKILELYYSGFMELIITFVVRALI